MKKKNLIALALSSLVLAGVAQSAELAVNAVPLSAKLMDCYQNSKYEKSEIGGPGYYWCRGGSAARVFQALSPESDRDFTKMASPQLEVHCIGPNTEAACFLTFYYDAKAIISAIAN